MVRQSDATPAPVLGQARPLAQRRVTLAPDALLWRLGLWTVPAAGILAALVIPFLKEHASA